MTVSILATIVLLGVLIFVHELGHFWAAKSVGVGVERFSVGLGPRLWGFRRGETEYVLAAIPLGGYVKMQGMEDEIVEHLEGGAVAARRRPRGRDFDAQSLPARAFVISAGVVMNMFFAFLLYFLVAAAWGAQELVTTRVMEVDETNLPAGAEALAGIAPGAEIARVGHVVPDSWARIQRALVEAPPGPLQVVTASPTAVFEIVVPDEEDRRRALAASLRHWTDPVVGDLEPGGPAAASSIQRGDLITSVAGIPVRSWADMTREIGARPGRTVEVGLLREGSALTRIVELGTVRAAGTGERIGRLGVFQVPPETRNVSVGFSEAVALGIAQTVGMTRLILGFLGDLFTFDVSPRSVGSLGTIAMASGEAVAEGMPTYLRFMALFSINLAILNMLPIPILDGGHMLFLGIELLRGRKLTVKQRLRWSQVGYVVVLLIMVWALGNDVLRFLGL